MVNDTGATTGGGTTERERDGGVVFLGMLRSCRLSFFFTVLCRCWLARSPILPTAIYFLQRGAGQVEMGRDGELRVSRGARYLLCFWLDLSLFGVHVCFNLTFFCAPCFFPPPPPPPQSFSDSKLQGMLIALRAWGQTKPTHTIIKHRHRLQGRLWRD